MYSKTLILLFFTIMISSLSISQKETLKFTLYNQHVIAPVVTINIDLIRTEDIVKLNLEVKENNENTIVKKIQDSLVSTKDYIQLFDKINRFEEYKMSNDKEEYVRNQFCEIDFFSENRSFRYKNHTRGIEVDERDRMHFISVCEYILSIAGLNPEEYIVIL